LESAKVGENSFRLQAVSFK